MIIIGIVGWKNSGKTKLVQEMIKYFNSINYKIATIKHAHHDFEIDKEDTDSYLHRKAGAKEVIISSSKRWAKIVELYGSKEKRLDQLISQFENIDIVIVEGFKNEGHKKIEVIRNYKKNNKTLFNELKNVIGIVSNENIETNIPIFKDYEFKKIGKFILSEFNIKD